MVSVDALLGRLAVTPAVSQYEVGEVRLLGYTRALHSHNRRHFCTAYIERPFNVASVQPRGSALQLLDAGQAHWAYAYT
jgi:hypothetical protein